MAAPGWPASAAAGAVGIRPLRRSDAAAWTECRIRNEQWLAPWEGFPPGQQPVGWSQRHSRAAFTAAVRVLNREARAGRTLPFAITVQGRLVGQVTVANVVRGAFLSGSIGYWVDAAVAGRGVVPTAVALAADHCFGPVGLHRVEADVRPENAKSLRVVEKLGFRHEGRHPRMLFIDGQWRDHLCFALTVEDLTTGSVLDRLRKVADTPPGVHRQPPDRHYGQHPWVVG